MLETAQSPGAGPAAPSSGRSAGRSGAARSPRSVRAVGTPSVRAAATREHRRSRTDQTTEANVACRCIYRLRDPRRRPVALRVVRCAEERAALEYLPRDRDVGQAGVVTLLELATTRIVRATTRGCPLAVLQAPIRGPLPDVASHVVQPVPVGRICADGRSPFTARWLEVLPREFPVPCLRHALPSRHELGTPRKRRPV